MARNDWMFAIFGWDPEYERKVPSKTKMLLGLWSFMLGMSFAALCLLSLQALEGPARWWVYSLLMLGVVALAGYNFILRRELIDRIDLEEDQRAASQIQKRLVPSTLPEAPGIEMAHHYSPFQLVGGDYYDVVRLSGSQLMVTMADVSGKGTGAALLTANLQALLRFSDLNPHRLDQVVASVNEHLVEHTEPGRFVTLVIAVLDLDSHQLTYVNAGHNPPLGVGPGGENVRLEATGLPLGSFSGSAYAVSRLTLKPGTTIAFYTDGLSERENRKGEMYEEQRILSVLRNASGSSAADAVEALVKDSEDFSSGRTRDDDTAVLVIRAT